MKIGASWIALHGNFDGVQCFLRFSLAQADRREPSPVVGVISVDGQYLAVLVFRFG
jgi:hypothetical protein